MNESELKKFNYEFAKDNQPDRDFIAHAEELLNWISSTPEKNVDITIKYFTKLADKLEITHLNNSLKTTYTTLPRKRQLSEVEEDYTPKKHFVRSSQLKERPALKSASTSEPKNKHKPVAFTKPKSSTSTVTSLNNEDVEDNDSYFCANRCKKPKSKGINEIIQNIVRDPKGWEKEMNFTYQMIVDGEDLFDKYLKEDVTLDDLYIFYKDLEPGKFRSDMDDATKEVYSMNQSLVAMIIYMTVKGEYEADVELKTAHLQRLLLNPSSNPDTTLWKHCRHVYTFYEHLGDMVILTPDVFNKSFFINYPMSSMDLFIDTLRNDLPTSFTNIKRFLTLIQKGKK